MDIQNTWNKTTEKLKQELTEDDMELWIKPLIPMSCENNTLLLNAPNKFFIDWLKTNCLNKIEYILSELNNTQISLNLQISQDTAFPGDLNTSPYITPIEKKQAVPNNQFNPKYTFDTFVVGSNNRFAQAAAEAVSKDPGKAYNPLFFYGGVGLGKTHLLHAIGHNVKQINPNANVLYITSDKFVNELIEAIRHDKNTEFRNKYRNIDVLLIDDIQFIAGKESTQEEFFHTFNTLYESGKQIVLTSDSTPKNIPTLEERLRSRFEWGVIADLQAPNIETRIAILRKKVESEKIDIHDDILLYIASHIKSNIRELEGSLIRVAAYSSLTDSVITIDKTKEILKDVLIKEFESVTINIDSIQKTVADHFNLSIRDLKGKKRTDSIALPRQIAMYCTRVLTDMSTTEIGENFGGRDHTTVMYACDKIKTKASSDPYFNALINKLLKEIKTSDS